MRRCGIARVPFISAVEGSRFKVPFSLSSLQSLVAEAWLFSSDSRNTYLSCRPVGARPKEEGCTSYIFLFYILSLYIFYILYSFPRLLGLVIAVLIVCRCGNLISNKYVSSGIFGSYAQAV